MTLRCPECRSRRATYESMQQHIKATGHKLCQCGGVDGYHYPHRPGSPLCEKNTRLDYNLALRAGASDEELLDILLDIALTKPGKPLTKYNIGFV